MPTNQSSISGNQNIVIQGVSWGSNINITTYQLDEVAFAKKVAELLKPEKTVINLVLLTCTNVLLENYFNTQTLAFSYQDIALHYGKEDRGQWKPYLEVDKTLLERLKDFEKSYDNQFRFNVLLIDCQDDTPKQDFFDEIKLLMPHIIWIVDSFALLFKGNKKLIDYFDHTHIGGCIIPKVDCQEKNQVINQFLKDLVKEALPSLSNYKQSYRDKFIGKISNSLINIKLSLSSEDFENDLDSLIKFSLKIDLKITIPSIKGNSIPLTT